MTLTLEQKRGLLWTVGIATLVMLTSLAWQQVHRALAHCFVFF
jgi:hypothetical protein